MKGLLILVDWTSGKRAGNIDVTNKEVVKNLPTDPTWQNIEGGYEIRLVMNNDTKPYEGVDGITILKDETAIDSVIQTSLGDKEDASSRRYAYRVVDGALVAESIRQKGIDITSQGAREITSKWLGLSQIVNEPGAEKPTAQQLYELNVFGIQRIEIEPPTAAQLYASKLKTL